MNKLDRIREVVDHEYGRRWVGGTGNAELGKFLRKIKAILDEEDYERKDLPGDRCPNGHYCVVMGSDATPCINPACEYAHESVKKQKPSERIREKVREELGTSGSWHPTPGVKAILEYLDEQAEK